MMDLVDKRTSSVLITILLFLAAGALIYATRRVLVTFLLAIFFAYLLEPLVSRFEAWRRVSRGSHNLAIIEVYAILSAGLALAVFLAGPPVLDEGRKLAEALPGLFAKVSTGQIAHQIGSGRGWSYATQERLQELFASHSDAILGWVSSISGRLASAAANLAWAILVPILAFFFLKDGRLFVDELLSLVKRREPKQVLTRITDDLNEIVARYIRAQLTVTGLAVVFYILMLTVLRVPYSAALGAVAGVLEFIPVIGPLAGAAAILGVCLLLNYQHLLAVVFFLGAWRIAQDYFTSPRLMGGKLQLHPLIVIFAVLVGAEIGGVIGVYLSIPIAAALRVMWRRGQRAYERSKTRIQAA
jgi:predicted PurR-regulated permease PerM